MVKLLGNNQAYPGAQWSASESLHDAGFGKYEPFREQEFRSFLTERYQQLLDLHENGCAKLQDRVQQKFGIAIDHENLRADFIAHLFITGADPIGMLCESPGKIASQCSALSPRQKGKLERIVRDCFAGISEQCAELRQAGPALGLMQSQIGELALDYHRITEYIATAPSQKVAEAMLLLGEAPSFEAVLKGELKRTKLFSRAVSHWSPEIALDRYAEQTALAHGRVLTQRVRIIPEGDPSQEGRVFLPFAPVEIAGNRSNFGFYERQLQSRDPEIKRPLMAFAPIRTIDNDILALLERYGSSYPGIEGGAPLGRSLLQRLETIVNVASHDYHHNSLYTVDHTITSERDSVSPKFFSHSSAPVYRSPPKAEFDNWGVSRDQTTITTLEQLAFRSHKESMNALFEAKPQIKTRLFEQASMYLADLSTLTQEIREHEGPELAQSTGRYLASLYLRELWVLFPHDDKMFDTPVRGSPPVNEAIRNLKLESFTPETAETYAFLEREGIFSPRALALRQGRTWSDITGTLSKLDRLAYSVAERKFQSAGLMPNHLDPEWIRYMDRKTPGWGEKIRALDAENFRKPTDEQHIALREFHCKESDAAIQLIYKTEYLAFRATASVSCAVPAYSPEALVFSLQNWRESDGWKQGSAPEKLMIRGLFPPAGPDPEECKLMLRMLLVTPPARGVWPLLQNSEFSITYNGSGSERLWMNADFHELFNGKPEEDPRYSILMRELRASIDPERTRDGHYFKAVPDARGLWLELSLREYGILPWLHGSRISSALSPMIEYRKVIESPTLAANERLQRAKSALEAEYADPVAKSRFGRAVAWVAGFLRGDSRT